MASAGSAAEIEEIQVHVTRRPDLEDAVEGTLGLEEHHLRFRPLHGGDAWRILYTKIYIEQVEKRALPGTGTVLIIETKDMLMFAILLPSEKDQDRVYQKIRHSSCPLSPERLYAFHYDGGGVPQTEGWSVYSHEEEFQRMGVTGNDKFRTTALNNDFSLCNSYPPSLVVPKDVDDATLTEIANYRQSNRLPTLRYLHPKSKAPLFVAGQPLTGSHGNRCYEDERMFRSILQASPHPDKSGFVIDLRSPSDAAGQKSKGGGTEMIDHYFHWRHVHARMGDTGTFQEQILKMVDAFGGTDCPSFFTKMEGAQWLNDVRNLMSTAVVIARTLAREELPVVIHGSTGYDLAAQASSMAQLMLDPYFRTYTGFQKLIEKEWLEAGHPFATRHGQYGPTAKPYMYRSPVFAMFLDCVWQCTRQYPAEFEFNDSFLLFLVEHSIASQYGTFMLDSVQKRTELDLAGKTTSVWAYVTQPDEKKRFTNPVYQPSGAWLRPSFKPQSILVWKAFFARSAPYQDFHTEVSELLVYVKDKHDMTAEEVDRQQAELTKLTAELEALEKE